MNVVVQRKAQERANQILCNMVRVTQRRMRGTHDAQMVIVRGIAYIVYSANDIRPGEGYSWPEEYCAMSLVDVTENRLIATKEIAVPSQGFPLRFLPLCYGCYSSCGCSSLSSV